MVDKETIRERLRIRQVVATASGVSLFTDAVPSNKIRYIIALVATASSNDTLSISKGATTLFADIPVQSTAVTQLPQGAYSIEDPVITLEGGANLTLTTGTGEVNVSVIYWDNDV